RVASIQPRGNPYARAHSIDSGADGETRTPTAFATAPSRQRVYQFHHVGCSFPCHFGTSPDFGAPAGALVPPGAGAPAGCGTSETLGGAAGAVFSGTPLSIRPCGLP